MVVQFVITAILSFLLVVVTLVILHELGHYLAARAFGLIPKAFSVGMGPELAAAVDKNGTRWKLSAFPIGGYVKFAGEMHPVPGRQSTGEEHDFSLLPRWKRAVIIAAGPAMNLVIAAMIFLVLAMSFGKVVVEPRVSHVDIAGPAYASGIRDGDAVIGWNGKTTPHMQTLSRSIRMNPGEPISLTVERDGNTSTHEMTIRRDDMTDEFGNRYEVGTLGLSFPQYKQEVRGLEDVIDVSLTETVRLFRLQIVSVGQILTGKRSLDDLSGPIRMAKMSAEQLSLGWIQLAYFAALISIAIGFMNLLPIPGLDGGYLAIYAFEGVSGRNLEEMTLKRVVVCGYAILALLMVFSFTNDIRIVFLGG